MSVNAGPAGNFDNGGFTSVTVCPPNTSTPGANCTTINGVLVDTGSTGLRLLASTVPSGLLTQSTFQNLGTNALTECLVFLDGFTYGSVVQGDMFAGGPNGTSEHAANIPIQMIGDLAAANTPTTCISNAPSAGALDDLESLGANGILGVGPFAQDCGSNCAGASTFASAMLPAYYFECPTNSSSSCTSSTGPVALAINQQVPNPVSSFATDNNGVILQLPPVPTGGATSASGSLVFGIGTQSNNGLGSAAVFTIDQFGNLKATGFNNVDYPGSFIDSGSNAIYFLDSSIAKVPPSCSDNAGFYCPTGSGAVSLSASNIGLNGTTGNVNFNVANADTLFASGNSVFGDLAGTSNFPGCNPQVQACDTFDWGMPFFLGRNVFTAIEGANTPGGVGPFFAY
jgi:hypothetical protein